MGKSTKYSIEHETVVTKPRGGKTEPLQSEKFIEAARELECDDSQERFDEALRRIAKAPPDDKRPKDKPTKEKPGQ